MVLRQVAWEDIAMKTTAWPRFPVLVVFAFLVLAGCSSDDDSGSTTEPPLDTTAPTVSLSASATMVLTASQLVLTATASDEKALATVTFYDGEDVLAVDETSPYEQALDLTQADNAVHTYKAVAGDTAGNTGESAVVEVVVYIDPQVSFINGGFDTGADDWNLFHFDEWSGWTDEAGNPPGCMRLNEYGNSNIDPGVTQSVTGLMPGVRFSVSGEYRPYVAWIGNYLAESFVVTVDSVVVGSFARGPNGEDWSNFSVEFTATETSHEIGFWGEHADDSSYELDNVAIEVVGQAVGSRRVPGFSY